jgi:ketosteroid isomerase-like protein
MADHPNVDLVRRGYAAFGAGDMDTLQALFSPDILWHVGGDHPLSGDYRGLEEVLGLFGRFFELSGGDMAQELHAVLANDDHAVALVRQRIGRSDGRSYDGPEAHIFHISDGVVTEFWAFPEDAAAVDAVLA